MQKDHDNLAVNEVNHAAAPFILSRTRADTVSESVHINPD